MHFSFRFNSVSVELFLFCIILAQYHQSTSICDTIWFCHLSLYFFNFLGTFVFRILVYFINIPVTTMVLTLLQCCFGIPLCFNAVINDLTRVWYLSLPKYSAKSSFKRTRSNGGSLLNGGVQYIYTSFRTSSSQDKMSSSSAVDNPLSAETKYYI